MRSRPKYTKPKPVRSQHYAMSMTDRDHGVSLIDILFDLLHLGGIYGDNKKSR